MGNPHSLGSVDVNPSGSPVRVDSATPFRILAMGNLRGRAAQPAPAELPPIAKRKPVFVDRDNFDELLAKLDVRVHLSGIGKDGSAIELRVRELDDFHPDQLYRSLGMFEDLRDLRDRFENPSTFAAAVAELRRWTGAAEPAAPPTPRPAVSSDNLLDQILGGQSEARPSVQRTQPGPLSDFLEQVMARHGVQTVDARQLSQAREAVDDLIGQRMRAILHHSQFQAVEALWRGLHMLVRRLETDAHLKLFVLDLTRDELIADLLGGDDATGTGLYDLLVTQAPGTPDRPPWTLAVCTHSFEQDDRYAVLLTRIARIAQSAGVAFLADLGVTLGNGRPQLTDEGGNIWKTLCARPESAHVALSFPRVMMRRPYGKDASPVDAFDFEEITAAGKHEEYLWGSSALACACLLGQSFGARGWNMSPGDVDTLDSLPTAVFEDNGEKKVKPCAEVWFTETELKEIIECRLIPMLAGRNGDTVRAARFQAISEPATLLAGRWS